MINYFIKKWRDWWWRKHPPEMVRYFKKQQWEKAKLIKTNDGLKMQIKGEKYPFPGFPRGHILTTPHEHTNLSVMKHRIKNEIFNYAWGELEAGHHPEIDECSKRLYGDIWKVMEKSKYDVLPLDKCCKMVKELWRAMTVLEKKYKSDNIRKLKEMLCFIFQEDDGYRFRFQWLTDYFYPRFWKNNIKDFEMALEMLEHAEVVEDMKGRARLWRRILMLFLKEGSFKHLFLELCHEVDWRKIKLSKADRYFLRGKWFKADYKTFSY